MPKPKRQNAEESASLCGEPTDPLSSLRVQTIYCGDNLDKLRTAPDKCVDLIYIDPPFNSNRNYEVFWGEAKEKRAFEDRHESTRAYIEYMRPRCVELARVLKPTGSFYYHCDWHASHYVKVMLDQIFGESSFRSEVIWKRASTVKGNAGQGSKLWGPNTDSILFYTKTDSYTFNPIYKPYSKGYLDKFYKYVEPETGRRFRLISMIGPGGGQRAIPTMRRWG
jgi:DNA modification methylase